MHEASSLELYATGIEAPLMGDRPRILALCPKPPIVLCPGCRTPMKPGEPEPIPFGKELADVTYVCESCGTTTKRTIKPGKG